MASKVWFVTGSSRGFGRIWVEAALKRGDRVTATARDVADIEDLAKTYGDRVLPLALDVDSRDDVFAAVKRAHEHFGALDVVVSNAGYGFFGAIEEITEKDARAQMETNFFGSLWVLQAALPIMRAQKSGRLISTSSIGGIVAFPNIGMYHASKWALEAINETLAQEVASFGIHVTLVEPAGYSTDWGGSSAKHAEPNPAYDEVRAKAAERRKQAEPGDPDATAEAILKLVDSENPPLRLFLGKIPLPLAKKAYESRIATWESWQDVSLAAQGSKN